MVNRTFIAVEFPESQLYMDREGFEDNAFLINDENGIFTFGYGAYFIDLEWLKEQDKEIYNNLNS